MSLRASDWREQIDDVDAALIDGFQSGFPIRERPFDATAGNYLTRFRPSLHKWTARFSTQ